MSEGIVNFKNDWGEDLSSMTIRHRRGNDPNRQEEKTIYNIDAGQSFNEFLPFTYETGLFSPFDYWWIKFITHNQKIYTIKDNFYCSLSGDDDGKVNLRIDASTQKMYLTFSSSSGCAVSIYKSSLIFVDEKQKTHVINL